MTIALTAPIVPTRRFFLGVERSACGRAWRDRLDERGAARALAIAQRHQDVPELLARILAGRGVEVDEVASFLDPTVRTLMPDPHTSPGCAPPRRGWLTPSRAANGRHLRRLRCRWSDIGGAAGALSCAIAACAPIVHIPDRLFEGYGPNTEAIRALAARGAKPPRHRRLRHHQPRAAGRGAPARPRRHRHRSSPGRRTAACGDRRGQSQPARRSFEARPSRRRRPRVHDRGRGQPRTARARLLDAAAAGARPPRLPRPCRARHRRRRGAAQGSQPRLRRQGSFGAAPPRQCRPHRLDGCRAARRAARALAPRLPARTAHQCRRPHRPSRPSASMLLCRTIRRSARLAGRARSSQPRASSHRSCDAGAGRRPRRWPRSASRKRARSS